jgi:uncharacterized protein YjbI with pentapeptide repeats
VSDELPPVRCDDPSTWRHKGEKIDLPRLLQLIEENGGPEGLDLHGCYMRGIDANPEALQPYVEAYAEQHGAEDAPSWLETLSHSEMSIGLNDLFNGLRLQQDADPEAPQPHTEGNAEGRGDEAAPPWLERLFHSEMCIRLNGAHLEGAELTFAQLEGASFLGAHLERAHLVGAHFGGGNLREAHLEHAELMAAHLEHAQLTGAHLEGANLLAAHLEHADLFSGDLQGAYLMDAHLEGARLQDAHLTRAYAGYAHLSNANLQHAHLEHTDFEGATMEGALWHTCYLDRTRVRRQSLGHAIGDELRAHSEPVKRYRPSAYRKASQAYLLLKNHFNSIGRHEDAAWAYMKEQQMEKMGCHWEWRQHGWHIWQASSSFWRWTRNWAYELLSGYGEWLHMPLIWAAVVIASFTAVYAVTGNVASGDGGATHNVLTALTHSIATFATVGFNTLEPVGWGARLLTAIEAMFGIGLFALFVFTLGNRMRRS